MDRVLTVSARRYEPDTWGMPGYDDRHVRNTLIDSGLVSTIDSFYFTEHRDVGGDLLDCCNRFQPQVIMLSINSWPLECSGPPTVEYFNIIRREFVIPIVMFWFDIYADQVVELLVRYASIADLHVIFGAYPGSHSLLPTGIKYIYTGLPFENHYSELLSINRDIDIGFLGTTWQNRLSYIASLSSRGLNVYTTGGLLPTNSAIAAHSKENTSWILYANYLEYISRLKISLNFALLPEGRSQVRARVWETLLCKTLLLEEGNPTTSKYFSPYIDYVPFNSVDDLVYKVSYYLSHEEERDTIRQQGWDTVNKYYSATVFWTSVFNILNDLKSCVTGTIYNKDYFEHHWS